MKRDRKWTRFPQSITRPSTITDYADDPKKRAYACVSAITGMRYTYMNDALVHVTHNWRDTRRWNGDELTGMRH